MFNYFLKDKVEAARAAVEEKVEAVKDFQMKQGDTMRSTQMAIQIAATRDQLQWGCGFYSLLVLAATGATVHRKQFPKPMAVPLIVLLFPLAYLYDFAYGTKLIRVRQEAEYILEHERERLVPPTSVPARKFWTKEAELIRPGGPIPRVSEVWPWVGKQ